MPPVNWSVRVYSRAQAAELAAINPGTLDVRIHRMRDCDVLFSERRNSRRVFSARDITVLAVAYEIERAGRSWLDALGIAFDHLQEPPEADALLILTPTPVRDSGGPRVAKEVPEPVERSTLVVPIGSIATDILNRIGHPE